MCLISPGNNMRRNFFPIFPAVALGFSMVAAVQDKISVTGAAEGVNLQTGAAPARININDLYRAGGPAWYMTTVSTYSHALLIWMPRDLYVQALAELQAVNEDDELSYFKIMGIHGLPFVPFNDVGQVPGGAVKAGFCPHNVRSFPRKSSIAAKIMDRSFCLVYGTALMWPSTKYVSPLFIRCSVQGLKITRAQASPTISRREYLHAIQQQRCSRVPDDSRNTASCLLGLGPDSHSP